MDLGIAKRVAIVTGSSQGIGKAIAFGLAIEHVKVTICARNEDVLKKAAKEIESLTGSEVLPVRTDLTNEKDVKSLVKTTVERFGGVDILVNNTGGPPTALFVETSEEDWRRTVDLLLMSVINCCREVIPFMKERKWGRIINMTSFAVKQPAERLILSNSIRAAVLGLTKTMSNELAEYGILVNAVCPGWTLTRRVEELAKSIAAKTGKTYEAAIAEWANSIPLNRLAEPEEIANLVVFLASEKASYITGTVMQVDGGFIKSLL
ncbi:SDR family oxidoreductase [Candidatus Bathyarchaeota archaeon]|nr:SDR family oxidoreductase [Candidatus Bathyarchaeota archaeon]